MTLVLPSADILCRFSEGETDAAGATIGKFDGSAENMEGMSPLASGRRLRGFGGGMGWKTNK